MPGPATLWLWSTSRIDRLRQVFTMRSTMTGWRTLRDLMKGLDFALEKYPFLNRERIGRSVHRTRLHDQLDSRPHGSIQDARLPRWELDELMAYYDTEELWFPEWEHGGPAYDNRPVTPAQPLSFAGNWKTPCL